MICVKCCYTPRPCAIGGILELYSPIMKYRSCPSTWVIILLWFRMQSQCQPNLSFFAFLRTCATTNYLGVLLSVWNLFCYRRLKIWYFPSLLCVFFFFSTIFPRSLNETVIISGKIKLEYKIAFVYIPDCMTIKTNTSCS